MGVRAVLFDADGVTQSNPPGWDEQLRQHGDAFVEDLFAAEAPAMVGEREFADVLDEVVRRWQVPVDTEALIAHWRRIEACAPTLDLVRELRDAGVRCYLASNQHAYRATYMRSSLRYDETFDAEFYSCDLGATKSSPGFFEQVLGRVGLPADEVLLVDDASGYGEVAGALGMRTVCWSIDDGIEELRHRLAAEGLPI